MAGEGGPLAPPEHYLITTRGNGPSQSRRFRSELQAKGVNVSRERGPRCSRLHRHGDANRTAHAPGRVCAACRGGLQAIRTIVRALFRPLAPFFSGDGRRRGAAMPSGRAVACRAGRCPRLPGIVVQRGTRRWHRLPRRARPPVGAAAIAGGGRGQALILVAWKTPIVVAWQTSGGFT